MVCLEEIAAIANILKTAPASTVQLLHKIVNDKPYSKSSRKELKKFAGFPQNYDIEARKDKILKDFTKTELITVCTILGLNCAGSAKELSEHIFKNLSDLASLKNNFTEQLTDDEDEDSAPFSLESTNDANKQPLTPPIYHLPSPQDVFVPLPQTQRNQSQRVVNGVLSEVVNEINSSSEMRKTVKINGYDFDALIDTGSTITLIRESVHQILGRPTLNPTKINLTSFGLLATFWIFFRCGQLIFRMADCEVKALLQAPLASPQRGQCPRRGKGETKEGTSERDRIR
ncbi:hypothetical protein TNCV_732151 [Trichonephila clavipes]|nr:hypothetical protein TNCV_732151 [Trichonephila clavipes]